MGASVRYTGVDSLDMSWLPLSRGLSREQCVLCVTVCCVVWSEGRGCHTQCPLRAGVEVYR
jgi:hypothetical protein